MRNHLISLLLLILPTVVLADLVLETSQVDLGYIYRDEPQQIVFSFENPSEDSTYFFDMEFSCDCTTAEIVPNPVPPNQTGKIVAYFDPMGYEKKGSFAEFIRVKTSDPGTPELFVRFSGKVGIGPEPDPRSLTFGTLCKGESDTLKLVIQMPPGSDTKVVKAYTDTGCVIVEKSDMKKEACQFDVIATNRVGCGKFAGFLTVVTTDPLREEIRIPVIATFTGSIVIEPEVFVFGPTLAGTYVSQPIKVYSKDGRTFGIKSVSCSVGDLKPEVKQKSPGYYEIMIKIFEDSQPGRVSGVLSIETECPDEPILETEITGYVRKKD
ncbi:MAG: DUF1573 domain-containing protein [bacterium]